MTALGGALVMASQGNEDDELSADPTLRAGLMALKYATRESRQRGKLGAVLEALKQAPWLVATGLTYILAT